MSFDWKSLQNGSDIRGVAVDGIESEPITLSQEIVKNIAWAFSSWLKDKVKKQDVSISVGHDSRISANELKKAVILGLTNNNCSIGDAGLASTPAMFMSTIFEEYKYDGAIMLTASHLPFNRNGMKFFTKFGGLEKQDISEILDLAESKKYIQDEIANRVCNINLMKTYAEHLRNIIIKKTGSSKPFKNLKIIVDAGNGAGGFFVNDILDPLGADTTGSQFLEPDGMFPNHIPDPENNSAIDSISHAVKANSADLGIIFDTDVDRAGAVDSSGKPINRNRFIALMSYIILKEYPNTTIVTDSVTSSSVKKWIEDLGGKHHRFKRGYKNVINEAIRLNKEGISSELALETSGHGALKENYFLDDGAYQISKILIQMSKNDKNISNLIDKFEDPKDSIEFRPLITLNNFSFYADEILLKFKKYVEEHNSWNLTENNYEGVHAYFKNGWILMRKSLHDPMIPINIESDIVDGTKKIKLEVVNFLSQFENIQV